MYIAPNHQLPLISSPQRAPAVRRVRTRRFSLADPVNSPPRRRALALPLLLTLLLPALGAASVVVAAANAPPVFTGPVPAVGVRAGQENLSVYDVAANFNDSDGDP